MAGLGKLLVQTLGACLEDTPMLGASVGKAVFFPKRLVARPEIHEGPGTWNDTKHGLLEPAGPIQEILTDNQLHIMT